VRMSTNSHSKGTFAQRAKSELWEYAILSIYLYVCFGALVLYRTAFLDEVDVRNLPFGLPAIKALVLAKFILLGRAIRLGERYEKRRLVHVVAIKALLYLLLIVVLSGIEEAVLGIIGGHSIAASIAEVTGAKALQILATSLLILLILLPYLAFQELAVVLGEGELRKMMLDKRSGLQSGRSGGR
jgi:hypothetical protein